MDASRLLQESAFHHILECVHQCCIVLRSETTDVTDTENAVFQFAAIGADPDAILVLEGQENLMSGCSGVTASDMDGENISNGRPSILDLKSWARLDMRVTSEATPPLACISFNRACI